MKKLFLCLSLALFLYGCSKDTLQSGEFLVISKFDSKSNTQELTLNTLSLYYHPQGSYLFRLYEGDVTPVSMLSSSIDIDTENAYIGMFLPSGNNRYSIDFRPEKGMKYTIATDMLWNKKVICLKTVIKSK